MNFLLKKVIASMKYLLVKGNMDTFPPYYYYTKY